MSEAETINRLMRQKVAGDQEQRELRRAIYDVISLIDDENIGAAALKLWVKETELMLGRHQHRAAKSMMSEASPTTEEQ